jgi:hypothetical protein
VLRAQPNVEVVKGEVRPLGMGNSSRRWIGGHRSVMSIEFGGVFRCCTCILLGLFIGLAVVELIEMM